MIACGAASGTAVWSTRIIELASVIAASVIFMFRREVTLAAAAYVTPSRPPRGRATLPSNPLPGEGVGDLAEPRRRLVAPRQERLLYLPVDPYRGIVPGNTRLGARVVDRGHLVTDIGHLTQHSEA